MFSSLCALCNGEGGGCFGRLRHCNLRMLFRALDEAVFTETRKTEQKQKIILPPWDLVPRVHYSPFHLLHINSAQASMR